MVQLKYLDKNMCLTEENFNSEIETSVFISSNRDSISQIVSVEKIMKMKKDFV